MNSRLVILLLSTVAALQERPIFRTTADQVLVDVSVYDGRRPVRGLTKEQFEVRDNGVVQSVQDVVVDAAPLDVTVILEQNAADVSMGVAGDGSGFIARPLAGRPGLAGRLALAADQIQRVLAPGDHLEILTCDAEVRPAGGGAARPVHRRGDSAVLDAITAAMMRAPSAPGRRQLIVALTNGVDTMSGIPARSQITVARRTDAVVHVVVGAEHQLGVVAASTERAYVQVYSPAMSRMLAEIAATTGGRLSRLDDGDAGEALRSIIDQYRNRYVLRYAPIGVPRAGWHELTVRIRSGRYDVRHRKGYEIVGQP